MRKKLCISFGFALIGIAALLFVAGNSSDDNPYYRIVQNDEASLIVGGGVPGANYVNATCTGGTGCDGKGGYTGDGNGSKRRTASHACGGTCGTVASAIEAAPE